MNAELRMAGLRGLLDSMFGVECLQIADYVAAYGA
jgi:hypothetical protein